LIHGAAGNVGAYAVQLASQAGSHVTATASAKDEEYVRSLGAEQVLDYKSADFEQQLAAVPKVDIVLDMVGGSVRERSVKLVKAGGILVSVHSPVPEALAAQGIRTVFFLVDVTTERLDLLTERFESGKLSTQVGTVLPLEQAQRAHEMLAGAPHERGKIVLRVRE